MSGLTGVEGTGPGRRATDPAVGATDPAVRLAEARGQARDENPAMVRPGL
jgi:hypothetical protein